MLNLIHQIRNYIGLLAFISTKNILLESNSLNFSNFDSKRADHHR